MSSRAQFLILLAALAALGGTFYWMRNSAMSSGVNLPSASAVVAKLSPAQANLPDAGYDWSLRALDGRIVPFSDFKGKTVFLNFWATWCGPCREEMPSIERMYQKVKDKGVEVAAVSWEEPDVVSRYVSNTNFTFPIYTFVRPAPHSYSSEGIPVTFIISPDGKIVRKHLDPDNWDQDSIIQYLISLGR